MTFKDLEKWEQEGIIDSLKPGENPYVEYTKDDIIAGLKKENQELKNQQKEFIQWLEKEIVDSMVGGIQQYYAKNHLKIYKEIVGSDNK